MGAFYTIIQAVSVSAGGIATVTHSLSVTPASLVVRPILRQTFVTGTQAPIVVSIGANAVGVQLGGGGAGVASCDVEVQLVHSIIQ
jgi:hypothetical protein